MTERAELRHGRTSDRVTPFQVDPAARAPVLTRHLALARERTRP